MESWRGLIAGMRNGDPKAFEALFSRYGRDLKSWIRAEVGNPLHEKVEVDDLAQETLLRALRSIRQFRGESENAFQGWLRKISHHVIQDELRKRRRQKDPREHEVPFGPGHDGLGTSPTKDLVRKERLEKLKRAVRGLSPEHRRVILLVFVQGVPIKVAAKRLGRTPGATSELLSRAIKKLRAVYGTTDGSMTLPRDGSLEDELKENEGEVREG